MSTGSATALPSPATWSAPHLHRTRGRAGRHRSAVIGDIADAVTLLTSGKSVVVPDEAAAIHAGGRKGVKLAPLESICSRYYLRLEVRDQPGVLAQVATIMAQNLVKRGFDLVLSI